MSAAQAVTPQRLAANRANAQFSTGPKTAEGRAKSSLNAVRTGLTGRTVLLPSEDGEAYEAHLENYRREFQPVGIRETQLVQNLADAQWRLDRIPSLENGIFALGRVRYAELFLDSEAQHVLDAHILMTEAKHFKNLHLQESRLNRYYERDLKELKALQAERKKEQEEQSAATAATQPSRDREGTEPARGFEFTTPETPTKPESLPTQTAVG
jgi:hypothetical protein